jgi:hypothetical protein
MLSTCRMKYGRAGKPWYKKDRVGGKSSNEEAKGVDVA